MGGAQPSVCHTTFVTHTRCSVLPRLHSTTPSSITQHSIGHRQDDTPRALFSATPPPAAIHHPLPQQYRCDPSATAPLTMEVDSFIPTSPSPVGPASSPSAASELRNELASAVWSIPHLRETFFSYLSVPQAVKFMTLSRETFQTAAEKIHGNLNFNAYMQRSFHTVAFIPEVSSSTDPPGSLWTPADSGQGAPPLLHELCQDNRLYRFSPVLSFLPRRLPHTSQHLASPPDHQVWRTLSQPS